MEEYSAVLTLALVSLIAAISPGPDFFIVVKNSLSHSRRAGIFTSLGVSMALIIHLTYTMLGIGIVIAESTFFYHTIKYVGVAYLFYIGVMSIFSSFKNEESLGTSFDKSDVELSDYQSFSQGFLTNLLNPKAALFFISLFSQFIDSNTSIALRLQYAAAGFLVPLAWYLFLSYVITAKKFLGRIQRFRKYIDRVMGGALVSLGMKLLFSA